jgi:hypothetical protein
MDEDDDGDVVDGLEDGAERDGLEDDDGTVIDGAVVIGEVVDS